MTIIIVSIVEDDVRVRKSPAQLVDLSEGFRCMSQFPSAEKAQAGIQSDPPDVVIMDINPPGMNGMECVRKPKQIQPHCQILMLTVYDPINSVVCARPSLDPWQHVREWASTRREWLLGAWLADARSWGGTGAEKDLCERNACELLTVWTGKDNITDYSNRQWNGLLGEFYHHRREIWLGALNDSLAHHTVFKKSAIRAQIRDWELAWTQEHDQFPSQPQGDATAISRRLFEKYAPDTLRPAGPHSSPNVSQASPSFLQANSLKYSVSHKHGRAGELGVTLFAPANQPIGRILTPCLMDAPAAQLDSASAFQAKNPIFATVDFD